MRIKRRQQAEWMREKVRAILNASEQFAGNEISSYPGHSWSLAKLLLLSQWVWVYTSIISKHFENYHYIDLLAGPGTTCIGETNDVIIGSPLIAHCFARKPFTSCIYIEQSSKRCAALEARIEKAKTERLIVNECFVRQGDCNDIIADILPEETGSHALIFVDNEGFDASWNTIKTLLGMPADILLLFPTSNIPRTAATNPSCLDRFFGDSIWVEAGSPEEFLNIYIERLKEGFEDLRQQKCYVSNIRVGDEQFYYDIILTCKKGPFNDAWEYCKRKLDWEDPKTIETTLDVLKGRTIPIDLFPSSQELSSIRSADKPQRTTTLEPFL